jgi:hypothetical protein
MLRLVYLKICACIICVFILKLTDVGSALRTGHATPRGRCTAEDFEIINRPQENPRLEIPRSFLNATNNMCQFITPNWYLAAPKSRSQSGNRAIRRKPCCRFWCLVRSAITVYIAVSSIWQWHVLCHRLPNHDRVHDLSASWCSVVERLTDAALKMGLRFMLEHRQRP